MAHRFPPQDGKLGRAPCSQIQLCLGHFSFSRIWDGSHSAHPNEAGCSPPHSDQGCSTLPHHISGLGLSSTLPPTHSQIRPLHSFSPKPGLGVPCHTLPCMSGLGLRPGCPPSLPHPTPASGPGLLCPSLHPMSRSGPLHPTPHHISELGCSTPPHPMCLDRDWDRDHQDWTAPHLPLHTFRLVLLCPTLGG